MRIHVTKHRFSVLGTVLLVTLFLTQTVWACTWDSAAKKCHPDNGEVVVYKHASCNGPDYFSFRSDNQNGYENLNNFTYVSGDGSLNDSISCYVIGHKTRFSYYEDTNFGGHSVTISNNYGDRYFQRNLGRAWWNDRISSVKVFDI